MPRLKKVLLVHQNFPGQFLHIAEALVARGDTVAAIGGATAKDFPGVELRRWRNSRSTTPGVFDHAIRAEADLVRAEAAAQVGAKLQQDGFEPDVIVGHPGWGETVHLREVFPRAKLIVFGEYFYRPSGGNFGFDPEFEQPDLNDRLRVNAKNAVMALAYALADRIVCPTAFQASTLPRGLQDRITTVHEGLDIQRARLNTEARLVLPNGRALSSSDQVITYVSRWLEGMRGFHILMRSLPEVLTTCPKAQVLVMGSDTRTGYNAALPNGATWRTKMLAEVGDRLDLDRVHFLGAVPHARMIDAMSISSAHVYYSYPFVLSWSLIEAMACECLIVGSDTPPIRDAIVDGENGLLHDFFDVPALSRALVRALEEPERFASMRRAARQVALERFDKDTVGVPAWLKLIDEVIES